MKIGHVRDRLIRVLLLGSLALAGTAGANIFGPGQDRQPSVAAQELNGALNVGYQVHEFSYGLPDGSTKALTVAIWYPTAEQPEGHRYKWKWRGLPGQVAENAIPSDAADVYPLVVFSHGLSGCGVQSAYLTEHLAAQGYVVAAPDHEDAALCSIKGGEAASAGNGGGEGRNRAGVLAKLRQWRSKHRGEAQGQEPAAENHANRPEDVKAVINELLRLNDDPGSSLHATIAPEAVAVAGHSLGGWTAEVVSGAVEGAGDARVKAALMMAPANGDLTAQGLSLISVPKMYLIAERDRLTGTAEESKSIAFENAKPPKFFAVVRDADHFTFADITCFGFRSVENCQQANQKSAVVLKYATAFFDEFLKQDPNAHATLDAGDERLLSYDFRRD